MFDLISKIEPVCPYIQNTHFYTVVNSFNYLV